MSRYACTMLIGFLLTTVLMAALNAPGEHDASRFVRADGTHFMFGKQRFYYYGANCFYLPYFAQDTNVAVQTQTWRDMADEVLLRCHDTGIKVIRTWAFNEEDKQEFVSPHGDWRFQTGPGLYREQALVGLDYVLDKANRLDLFLVLTFVNNWNDYGGMMWYVTNSLPFSGTHDDFYTDSQCRQWFRDHIAMLAHRTNTFNGRVYRDDPTIFAWQLANEPQCSSTKPFTNWVYEMAAHVKSIDTNHMVSTGEEGWYPAWLSNNRCSNVDYATIHCWPDWWWSWQDEGTMYTTAMSWVSSHLADAEHVLGKPFVLSEYGRMHPSWGGPPLDAPYGRNSYYQGWLNIVYSSARADGAAAGMHFWMLEADNSNHDDQVGSVFFRDTSTAQLIRSYAGMMNDLICPRFTRITEDATGTRLVWSDVVGRPAYHLQVSTNLVAWDSLELVRTNDWIHIDGGTPSRRFYRLIPEYRIDCFGHVP